MFLAPAAASANWGAPINVSGLGTSVSDTKIAGGTDGTSWVVWKRNVGGFDVIQGTRVAVDGTQGAILTLSSPTANADEPAIASRSDGSVMVGWIDTSGAQDTVMVAPIASDGTVGSPVQVSNTSGTPMDSKDFDLALGQDGTAGVAWLALDGANWVAQASKIAADGTAGPVQSLSDGATVSAGPPSIAAALPASTGAAVTYRVFWPQGLDDTSNVGSRQINADGTLTPLYLAFAQGGGNPFDVQVAYGSDGSLNAMWIRYRESRYTPDPQKPTETIPYYNWAVEWLKTTSGQNLNPPPAAPISVGAASPTVYGIPYNISSLFMTGVFGTLPRTAWIHDLNGGGQRVETGRVAPAPPLGSTFSAWVDPYQTATTVEGPVISGNSTSTAVGGWTAPGALPGQTTAGFTRFSNTAFNPANLGTFDDTADPGAVVADNGMTIAAYTGISAGVGSAQVMPYSQPGMVVSPNTSTYGGVDIGQASTRFVTIRSSGETPMNVTGVTLSGADQGQFTLANQTACIRQMQAATFCQFQVVFKPQSTGSKTAQVTVDSEVGSQVVNLTGSGLDRTRNRITAKPGRAAARKGKNVRFQVTAANVGGVTSNSTRVCVNLRKQVLKLAGNRCRSLGALPAGASRTLNFRIRVTWRAPQGKNLPVTFQMRSSNSVVRQVVVKVRRKGN